MKIIMISGSRNRDGRTAAAAKAFLKGVASAGGTFEEFYLPEMKIERCRQCGQAGWGACLEEGRCIIEDDFAALVEKMGRADAVVFATPVYFSDLSESIRAFLDRVRRITRHESAKTGIDGTVAIGIAVAGGGGGGAPACCVSFERALQPSGFNVVDLFPVRRQNLDAKKDILELAGKKLASGAYAYDDS